MHPDTKKLIEKVERVTGYTVSVGSDSGFSGYAQMTTATPRNPIHVINVNQNYANVGDYVVALQCAMILEKWKDPAKIPVFTLNMEKIQYLIEKTAKNKKLSSVPSAAVRQFSETIVKGLVYQLLSLPTEMMAMDLCREECPGLSELMEIAVNNEIQELHQSLDPKIRQRTPEDIFEKNAAMNAAFAMNWSRISGDKHLLVPFRSVEALDRGEILLRIYDDISAADPQRCAKTVDGWANNLNMASLYSWNYRNEKNGE